MKHNAVKMYQRVLALACVLALAISVLPMYRASAAGVFTVNTHEAVPIGTIAYPNDEIVVVCDEEDYQSYQLLYFKDENGNTLESRYGYYGPNSYTEPVPDIKGIDYWEVTDSNVTTTNDVFSTNGGAVIYFIQTSLTAGYGSSNNNDSGNDAGTSRNEPGKNDNDYGQNIYYYDSNLPTNDQFFDYWDEVIANNAIIDFGQFEVTDNLEKSNNEETGRQNGEPAQTVSYQVAEAESDITATPAPEPFTEPRGPMNPELDPTAAPSPEPTEAPRGPMNPELDPTATPIPQVIASPTPIPQVSATPTPVPRVVTATPTPIPVPKEVTTPIPTPYVPQVYVPQIPREPIQVIATVKEPEYSSYDIDLEVGRYANITPKYAKESTFTVSTSDKSILLPPRDQVGSFSSTDYESRAMKPGNAVLTFNSKSKNYTENWNVHVYCRPLDFEKTQYVVYSPKDRDAWITLKLKYFEYEYEYAYDFEWLTSEDSKDKSKRQIYLAGGDKKSTFARFCIRKGTEGAFTITVRDKYGNSAQTVLIVRPEVVEKPSTEKEKDDGKNSGNKIETPTLTLKQIKKQLKSVSIDLDCTNNKYKNMTFIWGGDKLSIPFNGYEIRYAKYKKGTAYADYSYKTLKEIKKGTTEKYTYTGKKLKKGKTYVMYVTAYVTVDGKKYYNTPASEDYMKIKIKK
ncbi:MAG: hypothetical protein K6E62_00060 [Lachnospiraceae bacterium]|nr:hypothetical protein [Lachnospiraceae bacterium]